MQEIAGKKAQRALEIFTSIPIVGMLFGTLVTMVVQSSTLVTVMVVGLVNSSMLTLKQAASVILGANIGTTLTAQMMAFRITDFWIYFAFFGVLITFITKHKGWKAAGTVLFAFAMLLLGLALMSDAMRPLRGMEAFQNLMVTFSENRVLGMLAGAGFTALIQSSTAATGIVLAMAMEDVINLQAALPLLLGANLGTCLTTVLASIGANTNAKRAAMVHVIFNVVGVSLFLIFLPQFSWLVETISGDGYLPRQVANAHTIFNVIAVGLAMPFISLLVKLVMFIVPGEEKTKGKDFLEPNVVATPAVALTMAQQQLLRMADIAGKNIERAVKGLVTKDEKQLKRVRKREKNIDKMEKDIVRYLTKIGPSHHTQARNAGLIRAAADIERISDYAFNIANCARQIINKEIPFAPDVMSDLLSVSSLAEKAYKTAVKSIRENDKTLAASVKKINNEIRIKEKYLRGSFIQSISTGEYTAESGILFMEILSNFEHIGGQSVDIAQIF